MVLAEAMAAGLAIITTNAGAIQEVVDGAPAQIVAPGDWRAIAPVLADGPLSNSPGAPHQLPLPDRQPLLNCGRSGASLCRAGVNRLCAL